MDDWLVWVGLVLLLIVIAAAVWFLLRRPTGAGGTAAGPRSPETGRDATQQMGAAGTAGAGGAAAGGAAAGTAPPEPGAGEAHVPGVPASETGHGAPGAGTAGVMGGGAGDSSAGHGSPGAHTGDIAQGEGYGAPGPGTAEPTGAGSAGPESAGTGYAAGSDMPYDQTADDATYGQQAAPGYQESGYPDTGHGDTAYPDAGYGDAATGQEQAQPAATGEHWAPPGADVGDSAPGAPVDEGATATNTEAANDVPPEAYPGGGTTTTPEAGAATAWDGGATAEPVVEPYAEPVAEPYGAEPVTPVEEEQRWQDTHAGGGAGTEQEAWSAGTTGTGESYPGPMDDTSSAAPTAPAGEPVAQDAGDYGYDEAHYGAASAGGYAPGPYGPGSAVPGEDGSGPAGWAIKGNAGSMLFHTPDSPSYDSMTAEVWFESEEAARAAGFAHWDRKQR